MVDYDPTRRQFGIAFVGGITVPLAGCTSDDGDDGMDGNDTDENETDTDGNETDTDENDDDGPALNVYAGSQVMDLEGVTITLQQDGELVEGVWDGADEGVTDENGEVEAIVEPGQYTVVAEAVGMHSDQQEIEIEDEDDDTEVEFQLESAEEDGEATINLWPENENGDYVNYGFDLTIHHADNFQLIERSLVGHFDETEAQDSPYNWSWFRLQGNQAPIVNYAGEFTVSLEPNEANDFEPVEETIEFTEDQLENGESQELTVTLEGAMSSEELAADKATTLDGEEHHISSKQFDGEGAVTAQGEDEILQLAEWESSDDQRWTFELADEDRNLHRIASSENEDLVWTANHDPEDGEESYKPDEPDNPGWGLIRLEERQEEHSERQLWRVTPMDPDLYSLVEEEGEWYLITCPAHGQDFVRDTEVPNGSAARPPRDHLEGMALWYYNGEDDAHLSLSPHE